MQSLRPFLVGFALLVSASLPGFACSDDNGNDDAPGNASSPVDGSNTRIELVAENLEFDRDELRAPAMAQVVVVLDNQDEGVLHNFSLYESEAVQEALTIGELFAGVETREHEFETRESGTYFFRCDVHPDTMTGTFTTN